MLHEAYPRISIVTPSFNQGQYLEECIDSILNQNYPNLEYIIMDGGSTDNSVAIIKKYEKYLTHWQSIVDGGQYHAINNGFKKTTGEIMTWLNSDDCFHPDSFMIVSHVFSQFQDVEWITGIPNGMDTNGKWEGWIVFPFPTWTRKSFLENEEFSFIQQEGTFWKRSLWERSGGTLNLGYEFAGDYELWFRFFRYSKLHSIEALLACFRYHSNQKSHIFRDKYLAEADQIRKSEIQLYEQNDEKNLPVAPPIISLEIKNTGNQAESPILERSMSEMGEAIYNSGDSKRALELFLEAIASEKEPFTALNGAGVICWQQGEVQKALEYMAMATEINPAYRTAAMNYAQMLITLDKKDEALEHLKKYLKRPLMIID